jgi:hypothetical protein
MRNLEFGYVRHPRRILAWVETAAHAEFSAWDAFGQTDGSLGDGIDVWHLQVDLVIKVTVSLLFQTGGVGSITSFFA